MAEVRGFGSGGGVIIRGTVLISGGMFLVLGRKTKLSKGMPPHSGTGDKSNSGRGPSGFVGDEDEGVNS